MVFPVKSSLNVSEAAYNPHEWIVMFLYIVMYEYI